MAPVAHEIVSFEPLQYLDLRRRERAPPALQPLLQLPNPPRHRLSVALPRFDRTRLLATLYGSDLLLELGKACSRLINVLIQRRTPSCIGRDIDTAFDLI